MDPVEGDDKAAEETTAGQAQPPAELDPELAKRKAEAEALQAIAEAEKKAREAAVVADPVLAKQQSDAAARQAIAEANQKAASARQLQMSSVVPDLSTVTVKETALSADAPILGATLLAHTALAQAARRVARVILERLPGDESSVVLVTTDTDLSTADAAHHEVMLGLDGLLAAAAGLLDDGGSGEGVLGPVDALAGAASALPGLLSLMQSKMTVGAKAITVDETAAVAAVAGQLRGLPMTMIKQSEVSKDTDKDGLLTRQVWIDDFRLVPRGRVAARELRLRQQRDKLVEARLEAEEAKSAAEEEVTAATAAREAAKAQVAKAKKAAKEAAEVALATAEEAVVDAKARATEETVRGELLATLIGMIDEFTKALHVVPTGASRSPAVAAALHEALHPTPADPDDASSTEKPPVVSAVILVKGAGASSDQVYKDRPFRSDQYEGVATVSLSYWALDTSEGHIVASGVEVGSAALTGQIGTTPRIVPVNIGSE